MIVKENQNDAGCQDASRAFAQFTSNAGDATSIDRVSYLFGMQAFCRKQLKRELSAAIDDLETGLDPSFQDDAALLTAAPACPGT